MRSNAQACARACSDSGASKSKPYLPSIWARMKVELAMLSASSTMYGNCPLGEAGGFAFSLR